MHHENPDMYLTTENQSGDLRWQTYDDSVDVFAETNATFDEKPEWFRSFYYEVEAQRGLDSLEDLGCPGELHFDLEKESEAILLLGAKCRVSSQLNSTGIAPKQVFDTVRDSEHQRRSQLSRLDRSAQQYIVDRNDGKTIIAGYPWFTDWGRDTFIAIRGLCIARGDVDAARDIVVAWADTVSEGMIPNRFPDHGEEPEFNSVDASLWYIVAIHEYWQLLEQTGSQQNEEERAKLQSAIEAILNGYSNGTRHRIGKDEDGLIAAGEDGVQLTWMDAKVDDWVVTPRIGKPVEIQCLWINALWIAAKFSDSWKPVLEQAEQSFREKFWNEEAQCLFDVIDNDHESGQTDAMQFDRTKSLQWAVCPIESSKVIEPKRSLTLLKINCSPHLACALCLPTTMDSSPFILVAYWNATERTIKARFGRGCWARSSKHGWRSTATTSKQPAKPNKDSSIQSKLI